ncbi:MAG: DUF2520 domain-containing protein [Pricia sp.]
MVRISILGTGNVAWHLVSAFSAAEDVEIVQLVGRNPSALKNLYVRLSTTNSPPKVSDFSYIAESDVYILAVSDDAIAEVSGFIGDRKGLVVHTSGSVSMDVLSQHPRHGVLYPLQSFSKDRKVDTESVPFCLEAGTDADMHVLKNLASNLSQKIYGVDSDQRRVLHLAAVFVNNFTNHLYHIGQHLCQNEGLPFDLLQPLIQETAYKIEHLSPIDSQTGPARRGDAKTINIHLEQLQNSDYKEVYSVLSESILNLYREKNPS